MTEGKKRKNHLKKLFELQKKDFLEILEILDGSEVNVRLLDPPVHEFLPKTKEDREKMAEILGKPVEEIEIRIRKLKR